MKNYEIINELLPFISSAKMADDELSFVDMILEFAEVNEIELQRVQEAISEDVYFKSIMLNDCIAHKIIKTDKKSLDDW